MYVKLYNQILDSSIADNRRLRHFFTDFLLCSDSDGNVMMTKAAIANRIRADLSEVEWGIDELLKPDPQSNHPENEGRRIIPMEGHGYGWKILNYALYRDMKSRAEMRAESAERVRRHREKKKLEKLAKMKGTPMAGEAAAVEALKNGDEATFDKCSEPPER